MDFFVVQMDSIIAANYKSVSQLFKIYPLLTGYIFLGVQTFGYCSLMLTLPLMLYSSTVNLCDLT